MPSLTLSGIELNFPFEPYECQKAYMKCVLDSIIQRKHAILESPTGTGKTLCLLVSSVSWLIAAKADMQFEMYQNEVNDAANPREEEEEEDIKITKSNFINKSNVLEKDGGIGKKEANNANNTGRVYPKIIYASRTHSQLSQVIKELKMTQYNNTVKTCAIGSRDQLCINPQIMVQKNYNTKMNMCKAKVKTKTCFFHNNIENNIAEMKSMVTIDIEDLIAFGTKHKCCPYYTARNLKDNADILFMPYNYLLDKKLRKSNNIDLKNSIVIFDEAHNVERVCEDSSSAEISAIDIASSMAEIEYIVEEMKNMPDDDDDDEDSAAPFIEPNNKNFASSADQYGRRNEKANLDIGGGGNMPATAHELHELMIALKTLEDFLDSIKIEDKQQGLTKPSSYVFDILDKSNINPNNKVHFFDLLQRLLQYFGAQPSNPRHHNGASLSKFNDFLQTVFVEDHASQDLQATDLPSKKKKIGASNCYKVHIKVDNNNRRVLCYWCLSPGYGMQDLLKEGARCIILTSGTLSPISTFKEDMKIPFDIVLENPHIIVENQIKVIAVSKGPNDVVLSSKYTNRNSESYQASLGQLIINTARIIPHGLLIFFPSYRALDQTTEFWRRNNQWQEMGNAKMIFMETKGAKECNETVLKYYERIKDVSANGAIMFAVCRGKISEGIDFANDNGRAVIVTGLPFPLFTDPKVILKRKYLDENKQSGQLWYNQQTYRAVNQAIGRVIRHKNDYGAILLCDERFAQQQSIAQLPAWMRKHIQKIDQPNLVNIELQKFFNIAIKDYPLATKIPNLKSNSSYIVNKNALNPKQKENSCSSSDYMESLYGAYGNSACSSNQSDNKNTNFFGALGNSGNNCSNSQAIAAATGADFFIPDLNACSQTTQDGYKMILQRRKEEEAKRNHSNPKCRVVVKENMNVGEIKPASITNSKTLLLKIKSLLDDEKFKQFKVALSSFSAAKKNDDTPKKIKYYKVLRIIFQFDLVFFREIEKFIQFQPNVKASDATKLVLKRKIEQCDPE